MFYGLNKLTKDILPKSLFYRALLIVAISAEYFRQQMLTTVKN